jgi:hypothetical protein
LSRYEIETPEGSTTVVVEKVVLREEGERDVEVFRAKNLKNGLQSGSVSERAAYKNVIPSITARSDKI